MALAGVAFGADYTVENVWTVNFGSAYTNGYEATGSITSITQTWDIVAVEGGTQTDGSKHTITLTKIGNSVSAAVDGVVSSTGTINYSGVINNITLGGDTNGYYKLNSVVHSISMSSITVVPEPATATLSLLALAGLAARRRRK